jgi:hypothetical protein
MSTRPRLRRVAALGPRGWGRIARTAVVARRIERSLRRETLDATARRFGAVLAFEPPREADALPALSAAERGELALAARVLQHRPFNGTCLRRALVFADILRDRAPVLRVGVAKDGGEVTAHAWVELDGVSLDPMALERFTVLRAPELEAAK